MKYFFISFIFAALIVVGFAGFRGHHFEDPPFQIFNDMKHQAKVKYQQPSEFFADGNAERHPIEGTMPMGFEVPKKPAHAGFAPQDYEFSHGTGYYYTGRMGDYYGDGFPQEINVTPELIKRGRERFDINCAICHGHAGNGKGIFTKYSTVAPADLTGPGFDDAANAAYRPDGKIFSVITNGWNQMGPYGANINVQDRWAIVAYVRTLQMAAKNAAKAPAAATPAPAPATK
jgi:mono/diheme cytochrome c family protein